MCLVLLGSVDHSEDFGSTLSALWEAVSEQGNGFKLGSVWLHGGWTHSWG